MFPRLHALRPGPLPALVLTFLMLAGLAHAGDWPRFRGPSGDSISPETGIAKDWKNHPPKQLWKTDLTDNGFAGLSVADGKLFVIDHLKREDNVRALDVKTGKEVWHFAYADTSTNSFGFARSTPTCDGGRLYTVSRLGKLHCLDAASGKLLWVKDFITDFGGKRPTFGYTASPAVIGQKLLLMTGGEQGVITALDKVSGQLIWRGGAGADGGVPPGPAAILPDGRKVPYGATEAPGYSIPTLVTFEGKPQILCANGRAALAVDPETGKTLWFFPWATVNGNNIADPLLDGGGLMITSADKFGCAMMDIVGGKPQIRFRNQDLQAQFHTPVLYKGLIFGVSEPAAVGNLICMDPKTGKVHWRQPGFEKGPVVAVDGVLLVLSGDKGELAMAEPNAEAYKELGRFTPLGGKSWTMPIIADGKLYVRNMKAVACFDLK